VIAIVTLLVVVVLSILITRVATIALAHTGLSRETARFQARSAFTGAGFTTSESERIVRHPVRRRIVMFLMLVGNAGLVTAVSSLILTFIHLGDDDGRLTVRIVLLAAGLVLLWAIGTSQWIDRHLSNAIDKALKRYTRVEVKDYASLIHLAEDYRLVELQVAPGDWLAGKTLGEARLLDEGIVVLGIERVNGTYLGIPKDDVVIEPEDNLIVYGRETELDELDDRRTGKVGDRRHARAVATQRRVREQEHRKAADTS
jgi:K+/H+ antiporter YhaU regulatory subunit KhtT